jgi:uncharacterized membrane-anchored protein
MQGLLRRLLTVGALACAASPVFAQSAPLPAPKPTEAERAQEARAAYQSALAAGTRGPADVKLLDQAVLHLPANMEFVPPENAARLLRAWGNSVSVPPEGLVVGTRREDDWAVVVRFSKDGYIKDDDAKDWKPDDLLQNLREGTEQGNEDRRARGFPELEIVGWVTPPTYDASTHRLVWSLAQRVKDAPADQPNGVNYNTRALGRDGYFSLNLLTSANDVDHDRISALALLGGLDYDSGKRYQDFNASTDHVAEYGLAALVGVVALKKLGIIALGAAFFLKFAKLGAIAVIGVLAAARRIFRRPRKPSGGAV